MNLLELFIEQRIAFEKSYDDGDWSRLVPYFSEDIQYQVFGAPFHCMINGRNKVIEGIQKSVMNFDKLCEREIRSIGMPTVEGDTVLAYGELHFRRNDDPPIACKLREIATYKDGFIVRLMDIYDAGADVEYQAWFEKWGNGLDANYA
ncbi:MAG: hypothetical protein COA62_05500 [Rhodobiaceae bacterium]|nr:MAG: hypothetical protein COA62_05500 [Rhodobiaceae bacterium]